MELVLYSLDRELRTAGSFRMKLGGARCTERNSYMRLCCCPSRTPPGARGKGTWGSAVKSFRFLLTSSYNSKKRGSDQKHGETSGND
ncbi:unnamed protein product [Arctia plantaginis]|uniref:Uncharacterized protein n=1 Tax=Arctia plantaginis TaxID=874455 RepID=A0A8S0YPZ6_ARCPL|nr:unnamed protein product [Arctia plantaginis]